MKRILYCIMAAMALAACGNKTSNTWATADSTQTTGAGGKHSAEYIIQRLDSIYQLRTDSLCCSQHYLALLAKADSLSRLNGTIIIDADHWTQGQDIPEDWSYTVENVSNITDSTAQASILIHGFDEQRVTLDLVFERGNWYTTAAATRFPTVRASRRPMR